MRLHGGPLHGVDVPTPHEMGEDGGCEFQVPFVEDGERVRIIGVASYRRRDGAFQGISEAATLDDYDYIDDWEWVDEDDEEFDRSAEMLGTVICGFITVGLLYLAFQVVRWAVRIGTGG